MVLLSGLALNAACQSIPVGGAVPAETATLSTLFSPGAIDMSPAPPALQSLIEKAKADLAQRLSIPVNEIVLLEATSVIWPDGSLGCPQPGVAYTQVPQDGLLLRIQARGQTYEYHSGGRRDPFLCVRSVKEPSSPPQIDIFNLTPPNRKSPPGTDATPDNVTPPGKNQ